MKMKNIVYIKANSTLGFLRRNLRRCPAKLKESAYISFVRSTLEYAASVWDPHLAKDINKLENIQRRPARFVNPLMGILKAQSNGPLYSNTVIGTLAVDGWTVTFGTASRGLGRLRPRPSPLLAVSNVKVHQSTASVPTSYYSMWHHYNCQCPLKG